MRNNAQFLALAKAGQTPVLRILHPNTKKMQLRVTEAHIEASHQKFLTITTIGRQFGLHPNMSVSALKAEKARTFSSDGQDFGALWLRKEVLLRSAQHGSACVG